MQNTGQKGYSAPQRETAEAKRDGQQTRTAPPVKGNVGSVTECGVTAAPTYPVTARPAHPMSVGKWKSIVHMMPRGLLEPPKEGG